jgi:hypothetical protein
MHYTTPPQALLSVLQDPDMPVPADAVLPAPGMASQSGCTYRPLQLIGAGSYATVWHPSRALDVPCLALAVLPDFIPSRMLLQGPISGPMSEV